ncbi:MAG: type I DNA topoisomerase [Candidatus Omnitrophota bacterium]
MKKQKSNTLNKITGKTGRKAKSQNKEAKAVKKSNKSLRVKTSAIKNEGYLVIVESPAKARTISNILGKGYEVTSSMGHIVDLPANKISVDVENGFKPAYRIIPGKEKIIKQLIIKAKNKKCIYIATDPDREGEAIGWHLQEQLKQNAVSFLRVVFHEITKDAVLEAFTKPHALDMNKINAQQARRVLDRIVGYNLSPLLWKKIVRGLSAGRVQSVALKFIVDREKIINAFVPLTTYSVEAEFLSGDKVFPAQLKQYNGKEAVFDTDKSAQECIEALKTQKFKVSKIESKQIKRKPPPPFTTSLMQQDAYNKLRFSSQKTMIIAQRLYEGIQINGESVGLITYMRTDSFRISDKSKKEVKDFIKSRFGENYIPEKDYLYKEKKSAQGAHEAIRPTSILRAPDELQDYMAADELKLYRLIWERFICSFMKEAIFEQSKVSISSSDSLFTTDGKKLLFDGFLKIAGTEEDKIIPGLEKDQAVTLKNLSNAAHTTKPPARFNDASLVKLLEEKGIGRPSTYVPTIITLISRNYIMREQRAFVPTELGVKVSELLKSHFSDVIDENFTAFMEEQLDEVEDGKIEWPSILEKFYPQFKEKVELMSSHITKEIEYSDKICPKCPGKLLIKWSRKGKFLSCENFPRCRYAESITTDTVCPGCGNGKLIRRKNRRGQFFYGCATFPACRYTSRNLPDEGQDSLDESIN